MSERDTLLNALGDVVQKIVALDREPLKIPRSDQAAINANLKAISEGTAIIVDEERVRRTLAAHEISRDDQKAINANLKDIACGRKVIVDPYL